MDDLMKSLAFGGLAGLAGGDTSSGLQSAAGGFLAPQVMQQAGQAPGASGQTPTNPLMGGAMAPVLQGNSGMEGMKQSMGGADGSSAVPLPMLLGALQAGGLNI